MSSFCLALISLAAYAEGHAAIISFGTADRLTRARQPKVTFRGDQGEYTNTGNRCVQNSGYVDKPSLRLKYWCKNSDMWTSGSPRSLQTATVDEGYCLGSIPNTFQETDTKGQLTGVPKQYLGEKKTQEYCGGDRMMFWAGVSAFHHGTHWVDM